MVVGCHIVACLQVYADQIGSQPHCGDTNELNNELNSKSLIYEQMKKKLPCKQPKIKKSYHLFIAAVKVFEYVSAKTFQHHLFPNYI